MMIFTILGIIVAIFFFVVIMMTRIKNRTKEKFLWNMEKVEIANISEVKRDKVVTRTGGLAHDRNRTYTEIQKKNVRKA